MNFNWAEIRFKRNCKWAQRDLHRIFKFITKLVSHKKAFLNIMNIFG